MYNVLDYGRMFVESPRIRAYETAMRASISSESVVLDVGSGTGIFALLACQLGAKRIYAIETDDVIQVARDIAKANDYDDRITFFQEDAKKVQLPEQVDVVVSDLRGGLPLFQQHIPTIIHCRQHFLAEDGILLPQKDTLYATLVSVPDYYSEYTTPWESFSLDMSIGRRHAVNTLAKYRPTTEQFLTEAKSFAVLDYRFIDSPNVYGSVEFEVQTNGVAHGLCVWFDAEVAEGCTYSNAPDAPPLVYGKTFFPLSEPVSVHQGDRVTVIFQANLVGGEYIWQWKTDIKTALQTFSFKQSTFMSQPLSLAQVRKSSLDYAPELNAKGEVLLSAIQQMKTNVSAREIAKALFNEFPSQFVDESSAQVYVSEVVNKYSK